MNFQDFINQRKARKASKEPALIKSLIETAGADLIFLERVKIDEYSARKTMVNFYDVLRSILEAIALQDGYKVYSHEAFVYFLKENKGKE